MSRSSEQRKKQIRRRLTAGIVILGLVIAIVITRIQLMKYDQSKAGGAPDTTLHSAEPEQALSAAAEESDTGTKDSTVPDKNDAHSRNTDAKSGESAASADDADPSAQNDAADDSEAQKILSKLQMDPSDILITEDVDLRSIRKAGKSIYKKLKPELEAAGVPKRLIRLLKNNPETVFFVCDYPVSGKKKAPVDISADVSDADGIPLFLQWDERWGYRKYGNNYMAITGCGPTCLSMVRCGLGKDDTWNPYRVAKMAHKNGYYINGHGTSWSLMDSGAKRIGLKAGHPGFTETAVRKELKKGHPVICAVRAGDFTTGGHFIVLKGLAKNGRVTIADPYSQLRSDVTWKLSRILDQTKNLWSYTLLKS